MSFKLKIFNWWLSRKSVSDAEILISHIANQKRISLLLTAYRQIGIHNAADETSGEYFFIWGFLKDRLKCNISPILFDVGANVGSYSKQLRAAFPLAYIHAFEPIKDTFESLVVNCKADSNIVFNNVALGKEQGEAIIYRYKDDLTNQQATLYPDALTDSTKQNIANEKITVNSIDAYCHDHNIGKIDFLKIDAEGYEFNILLGASKMLEAGLIDIIQFEFNEMNLISKVYLKDFYNLLKGFEFYRLNKNERISLGRYDSFNEIFQFQNIIAIKEGTH